VDALFRDLLIGVTSFFRDPEAFAALEEQIIPRLFADKPAGGVIRVWSTGCSTGEEAYSLAILLQEHMESLRQRYTLQVFATDIDSRAIATARAGIFPAGIAADVSSERLARFFTAEPDGSAYRIHKGIRDLLVFSEHDLLKDPPFSRLDLLSCRNLLIYLNADLQKQLAAIFHYALKPGGILFLGTSESPGGSGDLFAVLDRKAKLYQRKNDVAATRHAYLRRFLPPMTTLEQPGKAKTAVGMKVTLRDLTEQALLQQVAPAAALVNGQGDILYLHGRTGAYLEPAPGESGINNIVKMARDGAPVRVDREPTQGRRDAGNRACPRTASENQRRLHPGQPEHPPADDRTGGKPGIATVPGHPGRGAWRRSRSDARLRVALCRRRSQRPGRRCADLRAQGGDACQG
jgi:two-component system CheB/CheR fusion protein